MNEETTPTPGPDDQQIVPAEQQLAPNTGNNVRASWNFSLHDVRVNMAHCSPERRKLLIDSFLWAIDPRHPVTLAEFADAVGYDKTTVARIFQGKYTGPDGKRLDVPEKMAKGAREFLARQKKRFAGREEFVLTPTAQRIWTLLHLARESHTVAFVLGPSHIGKTWALENYAVQNNHGSTPYIRMKAASGLDLPAKKTEIVVKGVVEKPYDLLKQLAKVEGLLAITERIRYAARLAAKREQEISWDHFVAADLLIKSNAQPEALWD